MGGGGADKIMLLSYLSKIKHVFKRLSNNKRTTSDQGTFAQNSVLYFHVIS